MSAKDEAATVLKPAATLTTSYDGFVSDWFDCRAAEETSFRLDIVKGDATSIQLTFDYADVAQDQAHKGWDVNGTPSRDEKSFAASGFEATDAIEFPVQTRSVRMIRARAKKTGGTGTVTLAVSAVRGRGAARS